MSYLLVVDPVYIIDILVCKGLYNCIKVVRTYFALPEFLYSSQRTFLAGTYGGAVQGDSGVDGTPIR